MHYYQQGCLGHALAGDLAAPQFMQRPAYREETDSYGTVRQRGKSLIRGQRRRMNILSVAIALYVPWLLFTLIFAVTGFSIHYKAPSVAYACVALGLMAVIATGVLAMNAAQNKTKDGSSSEPTWYIFTFGTCAIAWFLGLNGGFINFYRNLQPYYDIMNLNVYPSVDPSLFPGQQLMDAGRIVFTPNAHIDITKAMGFKNLDTYCVAPITIGNENVTYMPLAAYDFWAVGINCCSGDAGDFHCGELSNTKAHAGLRLMHDDQRPFFRLAVQQAEAAFNIKGTHPLFFNWMEDPMMAMEAYQDEGYRIYFIGMCAHFCFQLLLVVAAVLTFSKMDNP